MTPNEIKEEVGAIALENAAQVEEATFWPALNRAIATVNRLRPSLRSVEIYNGSPQKIESQKEAVAFGKKCPYEKKVKGCAAVYLKIGGSGKIVIASGEAVIEERELLSNKRVNEYRFLIPDNIEEITVTVTTPYAGVVVEAVYYAEKISDEPEDVPSGAIYNIFFFKEIAPDLQTVVKIHYDGGGNHTEQLVETKDFAMPTTRELWLMKAKPGNYRVYYHPKPTRLTRTDEDSEIPLDEDLQGLLPLLICYYVWLEDKPEIAEAMYAQYMQGAADIRMMQKASDYPAVQDVYGW